MSVSIQTQDFDCAKEYQQLRADSPVVGAIVTFSGLVREFDHGNGTGLLIEHYPQMTETVLSQIIEQAKQQWPVFNIRIVHRIGKLDINDQIVFVGVNSAHRKAAFSACEYVMDFLKTQAPFWKKAITEDGEYWIDSKSSDHQAMEQWNKGQY